MIDIGAKWYKCDLHVHSKASKCFVDPNKSLETILDMAISVGIDCIAITDHNSAASIDEVKRLAERRKITVFPGVEITCSDSKIHILAIFDPSKTQSEVEDFLIRVGVDRVNFGEQNAHVSKDCFEVLEFIYHNGGIGIPAHVDEYNGISVIAHEPLKKCFNSEYILGIEIANKSSIDFDISDDEFLLEIKKKYNPDIDITTVKEWRSYRNFLKKGTALMTFSDNPSTSEPSKHGVDGVGCKYSWIKMGQTPSLEGLKQALLMSDLRVRNIFQNEKCPYKEPNLWIKSLTVKNSELNPNGELTYNFNPQLNCIIGGRGSGKSSFVHFLRGALKQTIGIKQLTT